jgi:hypothetical protein
MQTSNAITLLWAISCSGTRLEVCSVGSKCVLCYFSCCATLSITNPTWTDPGSNLILRGERPTTNRLRHGTAYIGSYLQTTQRRLLSWTSWPLKMGPISCPETSVSDHQPTLRNIPEKRMSQQRNIFQTEDLEFNYVSIPCYIRIFKAMCCCCC